MIGPLISRHPLNQSEAIAKPLVTWSLAFFYAQGTVHIFYFEFSLAPDSSFALIDRCDFFGSNLTTPREDPKAQTWNKREQGWPPIKKKIIEERLGTHKLLSSLWSSLWLNFNSLHTFSISFGSPWNVHRARPWRSARTTSVSRRQIYAAILPWGLCQKHIRRYIISFLFILGSIVPAYGHDALGARNDPGNQAISLHCDCIKSWEPVGDERVHVFHSDSNQPSSRLDATVWNRLDFKSD